MLELWTCRRDDCVTFVQAGIRGRKVGASVRARLVAASALFREETRGAHARADFPDTDPSLDERHTVVDNGAPRLDHWQ